MASKPSSVLDSVVSLCKRRGFVFPCGEIYGGTKSAWDYGPLGVELKENLKRQWWRAMVTGREDVVGLDSSVILPKKTWEASGHVSTFTDPLTECQSCHKRFRADHMQEAYAAKKAAKGEEIDPDTVDLKELACPNCGTRGAWTEPRQFNLMFETYAGPVQDEAHKVYLRPETAQGIFINFKNVLQFVQSTSGSVKFDRWPLASHTCGGPRMAASMSTTSSRSWTIARTQASLTLRSMSAPSGP